LKFAGFIHWLSRGRRFTLHINAPASAVRARFRRFVDGGKPRPLGRRKYWASLNGDHFQFEREADLSASFAPALVGEILQEDGYCLVKGVMQLGSGFMKSYPALVGFAAFSAFYLTIHNRGGEFVNWMFGFVFALLAALFFGLALKFTALTSTSAWREDVDALENVLEERNPNEA
jgi:hypothetical protein